MNTSFDTCAAGSYDALRRSDAVWVTETGSAAEGTATAKFRRGTFADSAEAILPERFGKITLVGYLAGTAPFEAAECAWDIDADEFLAFVAADEFVAFTEDSL